MTAPVSGVGFRSGSDKQDANVVQYNSVAYAPVEGDVVRDHRWPIAELRIEKGRDGEEWRKAYGKEAKEEEEARKEAEERAKYSGKYGDDDEWED